MAVKLKFKKAEVEKLIAHALEAKKHTPTFEQMQRLLTIGEFRQFMDSELDKQTLGRAQRHCEPSLQLVKDSGIYLMSNGIPAQVVDSTTQRRIVVYAEGYEDPRTVAQTMKSQTSTPDELERIWTEQYEKISEAVGGDDFVEAIPVEESLMPPRKTQTKWFVVALTKTKLTCWWE